ncbi:hypothetical protein N9971_00930, partial [bacterium]|nr:hypothetical protein [bacterium]
MFDRTPRRRALHFASGAGLTIAISLLWATPPSIAGPSLSTDELMRFAADMAERGNWREARFRWEKVLVRDPTNARVINNL